MSVLDVVLPWRSTGGEKRPPKPEEEAKSLTRELTENEVSIEYRNGDTETFKAFNVYSKDGNTITYNVSAYPRVSLSGTTKIGYERRTISYEVLAREPVMEEVETRTYRLTWETEYEWECPQHGRPKIWVETVDRDSMELQVVR